MPALTTGKALMLLSNVIYSGGAFYFDWNESHVKNPRWPPHARFHNGQTMSISVLLTSIALYLLLRPAPTKAAAREALFVAAMVGSVYCSAGMSAILYPGTDWVDPGSDIPPMTQRVLFPSLLVMNWVGFLVERGRLGEKSA